MIYGSEHFFFFFFLIALYTRSSSYVLQTCAKKLETPFRAHRREREKKGMNSRGLEYVQLVEDKLLLMLVIFCENAQNGETHSVAEKAKEMNYNTEKSIAGKINTRVNEL